MTLPFFAILAAPLALQAAVAAPGETAKPATLEDLPVTDATAPRCGVAFAVLEGWQQTGDSRGAQWPAIAEAGGQEFFVVAMARLMEAHSLNREDVMQLVQSEVDRHKGDEGEALAAMLPACFALLGASSQTGG